MANKKHEAVVKPALYALQFDKQYLFGTQRYDRICVDRGFTIQEENDGFIVRVLESDTIYMIPRSICIIEYR